jgi:hypothetical protein
VRENQTDPSGCMCWECKKPSRTCSASCHECRPSLLTCRTKFCVNQSFSSISGLRSDPRCSASAPTYSDHKRSLSYGFAVGPSSRAKIRRRRGSSLHPVSCVTAPPPGSQEPIRTASTPKQQRVQYAAARQIHASTFSLWPKQPVTVSFAEDVASA